MEETFEPVITFEEFKKIMEEYEVEDYTIG